MHGSSGVKQRGRNCQTKKSPNLLSLVVDYHVNSLVVFDRFVSTPRFRDPYKVKFFKVRMIHARNDRNEGNPEFWTF
jgi:hypothetical protein